MANIFSEQSTGRLSGVDPRLTQVLNLARKNSGLQFEISEGRRSTERQKEMVAAGKSQTMNSRHIHGNAVDVHLLNPDGSANWDFESYRPLAAAMKGAAQELGYNDLAWGGDWKTLKDGVHFQIGGPEQAAAPGPSVVGKGGNTSLLGGLSITQGQGQDTMAEGQTGLLGKARQPGGLLSDTGFLSPDRRDRLILAMQGMTMNPNQGLQQAALAGIQGRAKERSTTKQRNKTGEFLRSRGREDLASAVESGAIPAQAAVQEALRPAAQQKGVNIGGRLVNPVTGEVIADFADPAAPQKGVNIEGRLVDPTTGKVIADFSGGDDKTTAAVRSLQQRALAAGLDPESAEYKQFMLNAGNERGVNIKDRLVNPATGDVIADFSGGYDGTTVAVRSLQERARLAGMEPGTDAYKQFMVRGGVQSGMSLNVLPDGTVQLADGGATIKPLNEGQSKAATYAVRAEGALETLDKVDTHLTSRLSRLADMDPTGLARELQSDEYQSAKQAGDEFLQALLRKDTGAAITDQEQVIYGTTYIPEPGDGAPLIAQKKAARQRALAALKAGMSPDAIVAQEKALASSGGDIPSGAATHKFNPATGKVEAIK